MSVYSEGYFQLQSDQYDMSLPFHTVSLYIVRVVSSYIPVHFFTFGIMHLSLSRMQDQAIDMYAGCPWRMFTIGVFCSISEFCCLSCDHEIAYS
jgi:hypothetical protein